MKKFAELLNQLYFSYSHTAKTQLLLNYFRTTPDPDRGYALSIMAGTTIFPRFKRNLIREMMGEKIDPDLFALSYDYVGDLSETIALLWPDHTTETLPNLSELIQQFKAATPAHQIVLLKKLLTAADARERWAIIKLGTGNLRIGVSARFLKQTLAQFGNTNILDIENIWHALTPPYMDLFQWLEGKTEKPDVEQSVYFHPVMLAQPFTEKELAQFNPTLFAIERKYDGIRVQIVSAQRGRALFSRSGDEITQTFPDLIATVNDSVVLDGELLIMKENGIGSFNDLQQRLNRKKPSKKLMETSPAHVILYDILWNQQQDFTTLSFVERRAKLEEWFKRIQPNNMSLSEILPLDKSPLADLKAQVLQEEHIAIEGLMLKRKNSAYIPGRPTGMWYKWKRDPFLVDAVLMYAQRGSGRRSSYYSDFTFGLWEEDNLLPIGKAYFGFTDEELLKLDKWVRNNTTQRYGPVREVKKSLVFEIAFDALNASSRHKSGIALRFPRINRIRWDKPAAEADQLAYLRNMLK